MFLGVPAWTIMIALLPALAFDAELLPAFSSGSAAALYATFTLMHLTPKIAGLVDAALTPGELNRFGGGLRMTASAFIEIVFSFLLGAISGFRVTIFMAGLLVGRSIPWGGQRRDAGRVSLSDAATALWPHMVFGLVVCASLIAVAPGVLVWSLPLTAGYLLAIPFTVLTSDPRIGSKMKEFGIATIPEDIAPPPELRALELPERCPA
jgi:membrane glycosyltransferase